MMFLRVNTAPVDPTENSCDPGTRAPQKEKGLRPCERKPLKDMVPLVGFELTTY